MIRAGTISARCQLRLVGEDIKVVTIIEVTIILSLGSTFLSAQSNGSANALPLAVGMAVGLIGMGVASQSQR